MAMTEISAGRPATGTAPKQMLLLPTFDGQNRGVVAVNLAAIDLVKAAVTPGLCNVYLSGDHSSNFVTVELELPVMIEKLREAQVHFTDLTGGRKILGSKREETGE